MSPSTVRWRILALLVAASFISYVLRYNVSTAGPAMMLDLGLSEIQFGWILAAFTAGYALFQFPAGVLVDRLGPRRVLAGAMSLWAVLTIATAAVPDTTNAMTVVVSLIVVRFLVGVAHAPIYPLTGGTVERWFPVGSWALPNGLSSTGLTLGTAASAPLLAWLLLDFSWRYAFLMLAPLGLIGALAWWWYVRDEPDEHPDANEAEVRLIRAGRAPAPSGQFADDSSWFSVLKNRDVLLLMLAYACMNYVFYQMFNWAFYYLVEIRGFGAQEAGLLTSTQWIAAAVGATLGGLICDRLCRRRGMRAGCRLPAVAGLAVSGLAMLVGALAGNAYVAVACLAASFLANQLTEAAFWAAAISVGGRQAAAACGVMNTGGNAIGFVNALLIPFAASSLGWPFAMATGAGFAFAGAVLFWFVRADRTIDG